MKSEPPSTNTLRNLLLAFLVLPLGAVLWLTGKSGPVAPTGKLAESFQAEVVAAVAAIAGDAPVPSCSIMGNINWGVTCKVSGVSPAQLMTQFKAQGWQESGQSTASSSVFVRESNRMSVEVQPESGQFSVSLAPR